MPAALTLKRNPKLLTYDCFCSEAGNVLTARTREELMADCDTLKLVGFKHVFEKASTPEAWAALTGKLTAVVVPGGIGRAQLTAKFESNDGVQQLIIAGKSIGVSMSILEVRAA